MSLIDSTQRFTNIRAETLSDTSLRISWGLLENDLVFQNMAFSIYLGFGIYENLADTTEDFFYLLTDLLPNVNYTIRVESVIPYSTQMISSTTYHFLESVVTGPTVLIYNTSQSTQTSITTPVNQVLQISNLLSDYLSFILIGGILIIVILLVLVVMIVVVTCCMKKRRAAVKNTTTPNQHTNPILFELPPHANEIYEQIAADNPVYMLEKGEEKMDLGMDKISESNISCSNPYDV